MTDQVNIPTEDILGYRISNLSLDASISSISGWLSSDHANYAVCANPHSIETARYNRDFDMAIRDAKIIVPDGIGIVLASRILGGNIRHRITGMDLFLGLSSVLNSKEGARYFFLGSRDHTLMKIKERMAIDFPNICIAGTYSPPFKESFSDADNSIMLKAVNSASPDILWVGMTAPKQEIWIHQNRHRLDVKCILAVGAVFDFYAGTVKRPNLFFRRLGIEWLVRFLGEPSRLWRRNLISNPSFLFRTIKCRIRQ